LSVSIILDTDFLSAFLKIDQLSLVKDFYQIESLLVPSAVYDELSVTSLGQVLADLSWIQVEALSPGWDLPPTPDSSLLGAGERQAIALARQSDQALILSNDNTARRLARGLGLNAIDIPEFLLSCKTSGFLDRGQLQHLIRDLQEKDHYGFRKEILDRLLASPTDVEEGLS
jgi:predicted nucleic acid-binding protein